MSDSFDFNDHADIAEKDRTILVNGNVIRDLVNLCDEYFVNPIVKPYAGANYECMFCGATEQRDGSIDHSVADCPVMKYQAIHEKHPGLIKTKKS